MKLIPFNSMASCPACGALVASYRPDVVFSTEIKVPAAPGRFVSAHTVGDRPIPHLEKHCGRCGYGWLEEPASGDL